MSVSIYFIVMNLSQPPTLIVWKKKKKVLNVHAYEPTVRDYLQACN